eukprot:scaffold529_cov196-Alexandrium_tamarense.AAC.62
MEDPADPQRNSTRITTGCCRASWPRGLQVMSSNRQTISLSKFITRTNSPLRQEQARVKGDSLYVQTMQLTLARNDVGIVRI